MTKLSEKLSDLEKTPYNSLTAPGLVVPGITNYGSRLREVLRLMEQK